MTPIDPLGKRLVASGELECWLKAEIYLHESQQLVLVSLRLLEHRRANWKQRKHLLLRVQSNNGSSECFQRLIQVVSRITRARWYWKANEPLCLLKCNLVRQVVWGLCQLLSNVEGELWPTYTWVWKVPASFFSPQWRQGPRFHRHGTRPVALRQPVRMWLLAGKEPFS